MYVFDDDVTDTWERWVMRRGSVNSEVDASLLRAEVLALPPGHPYLRLPLQLSVGLEPRLLSFVDAVELRRLRQHAEKELQERARWRTTFTVVQSWGPR